MSDTEKPTWEWRKETEALKQQLAEVTEERERCVRDMSGWMEHGETLSQAICAMRLSASTFKQQLVQAQAARTICDVHQAEFDRLEEQLAQQLQQLGAITLALNDVGCPLDESGSDFILRQAQQLAQAKDLLDFVMDSRLFLIHEIARLAASVNLANEKQAERKLALAQMELRERAKDCTEHCEDFTRAQLQLNTVKRKLATVTNERNAAQKEIIEVLRICTDGFGRPDGPSIPDRKRVYHLLAQMEAQP